ncbi:MAG TPA: GAF domain-containing protein [Pyrinomonadaceae bacterium]|jgi:signal transduction histidine kinase|nr:GAF domain-containing protein [Pyrinomonadaceae bacterium]
MAKSVQEYADADDYLMEVTSTALSQGELSGLSEMLKRIAEAVQAYGCILWEVAPGTKLESDPPEGHLYVLAEWFQDGSVFAKHDMPLTESVNGAVVISQEPENIEDIRADARAYSNAASRRTIDTMRLRTMCSVPIHFNDSKTAKGTVSLYRNTPAPFTPEEFAKVRQMARLIPALYQAIRDRASQKLMHEVNEVLHSADVRAKDKLLSKDDIKIVWHQVCAQVAETFQCIETSIFMEDRSEAAGEYRLAGTTMNLWSKWKKDTYRPHVEEGVTGWVLANNKAIRIFSLADFERDKEIIQHEYPGLLWKDSLDIEASARKLLKLGKKNPMPPLSFMAAPIFRGGKVLGVIRCCTAKKVPYYFADRELSLLKLVAVQVSRFWSNWLIGREIDVERRAWQELVDWVSQLNNIVQQELKTPAPSVRRIFDRTLSVTKDIVTGADTLDVRLYDPERNDLYFEAVYGAAWREGSPEQVRERRERRFPVDSHSVSSPLGVQVYHSKKAMAIFNAERKGYKSKTFPQTKRIIVAPISVQDNVIGVLDLRGTGGRAFPPHVLKVAELLGQQLGLYYSLAMSIRGLREAEHNRKRAKEDRLRANQDLAHQLKNPLIQAHARIQSVIHQDRLITDRLLASRLLALRGLIAKAKRVSMSTGLLAELEQEGHIQIEPERLRRLKYDPVVKMLVEAAMDNEQMIESYRQIKFHVHRESFEVLDRRNFRADLDLMEQALSCLLDNAGKYSFPGTHVDIAGGLTREQSFYISVTNRGIQLKQDEILSCKQRLWRSEQATWTTGEGSGIGLWVVDNIMEAHGGTLWITATNFKGETQFRLVFPATT